MTRALCRGEVRCPLIVGMHRRYMLLSAPGSEICFPTYTDWRVMLRSVERPLLDATRLSPNELRAAR